MIEFFNENTDFLPQNQEQLKNWIQAAAKDFERGVGDLNIIFTDDETLYKMNVEYLNHDYYTDVITFNYNEANYISGDIFISVDRVRENARIYSQSFEDELHRVIIHGVLHLLGFDDKTEDEQKQMREKEDFYLAQLKNF